METNQMMMSDPIDGEMKKAVEQCKKDVHLDPDSQSPKFSGHESAPYGGGAPSAAGPSSKGPGTGNSKNSSMSY
jgi:hypothetical protein